MEEQRSDSLTEWLADVDTPQAYGADSSNALLVKVSQAITEHTGTPYSLTPHSLDLLEIELDRKHGHRMGSVKIGNREKWLFVFSDMFGP